MLTSRRTGDRLCVHLSGEIDHCVASSLRGEIEALLQDTTIRSLWLDFTDVGMIIGRYKTMKARGGSVHACGLHPPVDKLFHLAGLHRIISITGGHTEHE